MKRKKKMAGVRTIADLIASAPNWESALDCVLEGIGAWPVPDRRQFLKRLAGWLPESLARRTIAARSATAFSNEQLTRLVSHFSEKLGCPLRLDCRIDGSLIAGLEVTVGDLRWDYSLGRILKTFGSAG